MRAGVFQTEKSEGAADVGEVGNEHERDYPFVAVHPAESVCIHWQLLCRDGHSECGEEQYHWVDSEVVLFVPKEWGVLFTRNV